jgi:hypothetical protein
MFITNRCHNRWTAAIAAGVVAFGGVCLIAGQEMTPQSRISGAWELDAGASSPLWSRMEADAAAKGGKGAEGRGSVGDSSEPLPSAVRAAVNLMSDLADVPLRMALTAKPESLTVIDEHGAMRQFKADNKTERVDFGTARVSIRTRWNEVRLVQDMTADGIDMSRAFEAAPDGKQLTVSLTVRRQPDPRLLDMMSDHPLTRTYIYRHQ